MLRIEISDIYIVDFDDETEKEYQWIVIISLILLATREIRPMTCRIEVTSIDVNYSDFNQTECVYIVKVQSSSIKNGVVCQIQVSCGMSNKDFAQKFIDSFYLSTSNHVGLRD